MPAPPPSGRQSARLLARQPEAERHLIFRDWLRSHPEDRALYETAKVIAAEGTRAAHGHVMDYNSRKEQALREIYSRAFRTLGLTT